MDLEALLAATADRLMTVQKAEDGPAWYAGEFEMTLHYPEPLPDYNFLSGYTLLHLARTRALLGAGTPEAVGAMLAVGCGLARHYRSSGEALNWYSGKGTGDHVPPFFDWGARAVLSIRDDLDDTAIAALLTALEPGFACSAAPSTYPVVAPGIPLRESSKQRLAAAGVERDVYMSWVLPQEAAAPEPTVRWMAVPWENSVELVTVAHIAAAVGDKGGDAARTASSTFVNRLLDTGVKALMAGDAAPLAFAARYYPRVPFAPVAYALRAHALSGGTLLTPKTLDTIEAAVASVDTQTRIASDAFAAELYYLWAAANLVYAGAGHLRLRALEVAAQLASEVQDGLWPDVVFFHDAHIGDYSGAPHAAALACEALALLIAAEATP